MKRAPVLNVFILLLIVVLGFGCAHGKVPVILDHPPQESYEVIESIEVIKEWHGLQWLWHWWHYMPWYPTVHRVHDKALIKKARRLGADAIINVEYLGHRQGAKAEAIRFKAAAS